MWRKGWEWGIKTLFALAVSLRYRVKVIGLDRLKGENGVLVLPNHVSTLDPVILEVASWEILRSRPVIVKQFYELSGAGWLFRMLGAISVPDFYVGKNSYKLQQWEKTVQQIVEGLDNGDNILFYPAGRLMVDGREKLEGASGVYQLLQLRPDVPICLVRIRGLWGSRFSTAPHGMTPDIKKEALSALKEVLKSFIFFMPRRQVTLEFSLVPDDFPRVGSKNEINRYLEEWYNAPYQNNPSKEEPFISIPYTPWSKRKRTLRRIANYPSIEKLGEGKQETRDKVLKVVSEIAEVPLASIGLDTHLGDDLSLDSWATSELLVFLEKEFGLQDLRKSEIATPRLIIALVEGRWIPRRVLALEKERKRKINRRRLKGQPNFTDSLDLAAFFKYLKKRGEGAAFKDKALGWIDYQTFCEDVESFVAFVRHFEASQMAVMLPGGYHSLVAFMGIVLAGKQPFMVDPALGSKVLNTIWHRKEIGKVISSDLALNHWNGFEFGSIDRKLVLIERVLKMQRKLFRVPFEQSEYASIFSKEAGEHKIALNGAWREALLIYKTEGRSKGEIPPPYELSRWLAATLVPIICPMNLSK